MRFEDYANEWKAGQRDLAPASVRHLDSLLEHHLFPALGSRRMNTFDHKVVDRFIQSTERNNVGLATRTNTYDKLKSGFSPRGRRWSALPSKVPRDPVFWHHTADGEQP